MKNIIVAIFATFILTMTISAQSGTGRLKGFVSSGIKNGSAIDASVELRAIENNSKTQSVETVQTNGGYYNFEVSFGYYLLTISAKGYETYQTKVYIPSSSTLNWGTILEKSPASVSKCISGNCDNGKGKLIYADGNVYKGDFVKGKKDGQGTYTFRNGNYYSGQWKNNLKNGSGKEYTKATATTREGSWKNDVFVGVVK